MKQLVNVPAFPRGRSHAADQQKSRAVSEADRKFLATLGIRPDLPRASLRVRRGAVRFPRVELTGEICEDGSAVTLASSLAAERAIEQRLEADHEDDARHLHPHVQPVRIELGDRP